MKTNHIPLFLTLLLAPLTSITVMCPETVEAADSSYSYQRYTFPDAPKEVVGVKYSPKDNKASMPLGGLGTGTVYLNSRGVFEGNALMNTYRPIPGTVPDCFFALRTDAGAQVLQTTPIHGWPVVQDLSYLGHFPVVDIDYQTGLGIGAQLRAAAPFILGDSRASGTPGAMFKLRLKNPDNQPRKASVAFSWRLPDAIPFNHFHKSQGGDAEGCAYWNLGQLEAGQSIVVPVVLAAAESRDKLAALLADLRLGKLREPDFTAPASSAEVSSAPDATGKKAATSPTASSSASLDPARGTAVPISAPAAPATVSYENSPRVMLTNEVTELVVDPAGVLNKDDSGSAACMNLSGQPTLSHYGIRIGWQSGEQMRSGVDIALPPGQRLANLRIDRATSLGPDGLARTGLRSNDGILAVDLVTQLVAGQTAAVQWVRIKNIGSRPINRLRLAAYANQNVSNDPTQDISMLDTVLNAVVTGRRTGDGPVAALTGLKTVDAGAATSWGPKAWWLDSINEMHGMSMGEAKKYSRQVARETSMQSGEAGKMVWAGVSEHGSADGWTIAARSGEGQKAMAGFWDGQSAEGVAKFWKQFSAGQLQPAAKGKPGEATVVLVDVDLPPNGEKEVDFILGWYYTDARDAEGTFIGHQYANWFDSSLAVARQVNEKWEDWWAGVGGWQEKIYRADVPDWLKDNAVNSLAPLARNSFWTKDGRFAVNESLVGCPIMETMPMRFYGSTVLARYFPELDRQTLRQFVALQREDGAIPHAFGRGEILDDPLYGPQCITNNSHFILMVWRHYFLSRDKAWAREMLPAVKKAMDFMRSLDRDGDGLVDNFTYAIYDRWMWHGSAIHTSSLQLAAARAAEELAKAAGDDDYAAASATWLSKWQPTCEELLWNGKYYRLYNSRKTGEISEISLLDPLPGQWYASLYGLGDLHPKDRIASALDHISQVNSKQAQGIGLLTAVLADGTPDQTPPPGAPADSGGVYQPYVTVGGVHQHTALNILYGKKAEGLEFSKQVWDFFALRKRTPFNTTFNLDPRTGEPKYMPEYYSNMSIWTVLEALNAAP